MESENLRAWRHVTGCQVHLSTLNPFFWALFDHVQDGNTHGSSLQFWKAIIDTNFFLLKKNVSLYLCLCLGLSPLALPAPLYLTCLWSILRSKKNLSSFYIKAPQIFDECSRSYLDWPNKTPFRHLFLILKWFLYHSPSWLFYLEVLQDVNNIKM